MIPEQVKTLKIQAGVQVLRLEDKDIIFSIGSALEDISLFVFVLVRNINVALSLNSKNVCLTCNECLFSANHDACIVNYLKDVQKRKKAKSVKQKEKNAWKPTGRIFITVGHRWIRTGRTFNLVGNQCPLTRTTPAIIIPPGQILTTRVISIVKLSAHLNIRYDQARKSLTRAFINSDSHPLNENQLGLHLLPRVQENHPHLEYLGVT
ncbi:hypothetical protein Tco_1457825 [Tanacetum coccineum]